MRTVTIATAAIVALLAFASAEGAQHTLNKAFAPKRNGRIYVDPTAKVTPLEQLLPNNRIPDSIPEVVDWAKDGFVRSPANIGECGGETVAVADAINMESQAAVHNKAPVTQVSVQELLNCAISCNGARLGAGIQWVINNNSGKIDTASSYKSGKDNSCNANSGTAADFTVTGYHHLPKHETTMAFAVANLGPIMIALDDISLQTYVGGVLMGSDCRKDTIDAAAVLVGYNLKQNPPYWILQNDWGNEWGMNGYAYLQFGNNTCGITSDPTTAELKF